MVRLRFGAAAVISTGLSSGALALPDFTRTVGLPEPKSITLYHDNTDPNLYWAPPTSLEYALQADGETPVYSILHYGISGPSISGGMGAVLTTSVRPIIDEDLLPDEWEKIKKDNPDAKIAVLAPDAAYLDLVIGSALFDPASATQVRTTLVREEARIASENPAIPDTAKTDTLPDEMVLQDLEGTIIPSEDGSVTVIQDPSVISTALGAQVGGYQVFAVSLTPDAGATFATRGGEDATNFGARYRYTVSGIRTRLKAEITVNWSRVYEHIHEEAGGGWFSFKGRHAVDIQTLKETGAVRINIIEGGFENNEDEFETIYNTLVKAQINGEGIFKPTLSPTAPPGAPATQGTFFGWSFSGAWSYQKLTEMKEFTFTIDRQVIGKREFAIGMGFQGMCSKYPNLFVAQGVTGPGCIEETEIVAAAQRMTQLRARCDQAAVQQREDLYRSIALLPNPDLQKMAYLDSVEAVADYRFACLQGK